MWLAEKASLEMRGLGIYATSDLLSPADRALVALGRALMRENYRFITVTPARHWRINARQSSSSPTMRDIFGWNRTFCAGDLADEQLDLLATAGVLERSGHSLRAMVRFSTLGGQIFVDTAFPTSEPGGVFFGPDTYRFARFISQRIPRSRFAPLRILDLGAGSGAGGLQACAFMPWTPASIVLSDINPRALRFCHINAVLNDVPNVGLIESDLFADIDGTFDLILSNPPYLVDPLARLYRHGGGELGSELRLRIVEESLNRLSPGGKLIFYTGSAIVNGVDAFQRELSLSMRDRELYFSYQEIDPDVFGEELDTPPYACADRIAVVGVTIDRLEQES